MLNGDGYLLISETRAIQTLFEIGRVLYWYIVHVYS